jgi:hypothetical protein
MLKIRNIPLYMVAANSVKGDFGEKPSDLRGIINLAAPKFPGNPCAK